MTAKTTSILYWVFTIVFAALMILGEKGVIEGDIKTKSAIIYGTVNGNVKTTQLEIKKTGNIHGDISTDILEIEIGALYNGKLNMQRPQVLAEAS